MSAAILKAPATVESLTRELGEARRRLSEMTSQLDRTRHELGQARESNIRLRHLMVAGINSAKHLRREAVRQACAGLLAQREALRERIAVLERDDRWRTAVGDERAEDVELLLSERAELRGDVMALWQRLGDMLSVVDARGFQFAEAQRKIRDARALHALWVNTEEPCNASKK